RGPRGHHRPARTSPGAALHPVRAGRGAGERVTEAAGDADREAREHAFEDLFEDRPLSPPQARELQAMIGSLDDMAREGTSVGDLKIANAALAEMAEAFRVFRPYRQ